MATDPAVQAVYKFLDKRFDESMPDWWPPLESWAEDIVEIITPLIDPIKETENA